MTLSNGLKITETLKNMLQTKGIKALTVVNNQTVFIYENVQTDYDYTSYITYKVADVNAKMKRSRFYEQMNDSKVLVNGIRISMNDIIVLDDLKPILLNENAVYNFMKDETKKEGYKDEIEYLISKLDEEEDNIKREKIIVAINKIVD